MKKIGFDKARFIAALLVVAIHVYPFVTISEDFDFLFTHVLCRIAVPLFFMITGYFVIPKALESKSNLILYSRKILKIYLLCIIIYLPINIYSGYFNGINIINILRDIFVNGTFYHLWYFPALILGIWILYFMVKNYRDCIVKIIVLILFIVGIFGDSYYGISDKVSVLNFIYKIIFSISKYTRNGLFYAPIFLYLGYSFNNRNFKLDKVKNIILLTIFILLMELEGYILNLLNFQRHDSMYFSLILVMILIFNLLIVNKKEENRELRNISTLIYIIHPLFIIVVRVIAKITHLENILIDNNLVNYIFVVFLSLGFSIIFEKIKRITKTNVNNERKLGI